MTVRRHPLLEDLSAGLDLGKGSLRERPEHLAPALGKPEHSELPLRPERPLVHQLLDPRQHGALGPGGKQPEDRPAVAPAAQDSRRDT